MILAIVFAHVWGVIQLIVLGSLARTVRVRTVLAAFAVGLYAVAPLTLLLQVAWTRPVASLLGLSISRVVATASYTVDPFLEEIMKVLPLAVLLLIPVIRRQWSLTDCALIGAATGSGFALAEHLYRFSSVAGSAHAVAGGWVFAPIRAWLFVPGIMTSLTSWLPVGVSFAGDSSRANLLNFHLAWSAIGGFAVGLVVLNGKRAAQVVALGLFLCIGLDHAAGNATDIRSTWLAWLATPLGALTNWTGVMTLAALAAAWMLDRGRQHPGTSPELLLAAERAASTPIVGTLRAAVSRLPWSLPWVDHFVRTRRTLHTTRAIAPAEADGLQSATASARDRVDLALAQTASPPLLPAGWTPGALREAVRQPMVIVWLVLMAPSVLWFVVGGWPPAARIQTVMIGPIVWKLVSVLSVAMQAWVGWHVIVAARAWSKTRAVPVGDDAANLALRIACGVGAIGLGGFSLLRMLNGLPPGSSLLSSLHVAEAANRVSGAGGSMLGDSAGAFTPTSPASVPPGEAATAPGAQGPGGAEDASGEDQSGPEPGSGVPGEPADAGELDDPEDVGPQDEPTDVGDLDEPRDVGDLDDEPRDVGDLDEPRDVGDLDQSQNRAHSPKPDPAAAARDQAARAAADADASSARAEQADLDKTRADERYQQATRAADAADIAKETADPGSDPAVAAARERAQLAHDKSIAADAAAVTDDIDDPWGGGNSKKAAADAARAESNQADAAQRAAENDFASRKAAEADAAKDAMTQAKADAMAADSRAADAGEAARTSEAAAGNAQQNAAREAARAADPLGAAADDAAANHAAAQKRADDAFYHTENKDPDAYKNALKEAALAKERAEQARALADAGRSGRGSLGWKDKP